MRGNDEAVTEFDKQERHPLVFAIAEERFEDAEILRKRGHTLFSDQGHAAREFGCYGRLGPDEDYFYIGRWGDGEYGDIFDALFFDGKVRGLYYALSTSTKEQLDRRDAAGKCIFPSSYIFLSLYLSMSSKSL